MSARQSKPSVTPASANDRLATRRPSLRRCREAERAHVMRPTELRQLYALNAEQVAIMLGGVSAETVRGYLHRLGRLRGHRIGKELRWRQQDVAEFIEQLGTRW